MTVVRRDLGESFWNSEDLLSRKSFFKVFQSVILEQGARLIDPNDLLVRDADAVSVNQYNVRLLGDVDNVLKFTYDLVDIDQDKSKLLTSTAILMSESNHILSIQLYRYTVYIL